MVALGKHLRIPFSYTWYEPGMYQYAFKGEVSPFEGIPDVGILEEELDDVQTDDFDSTWYDDAIDAVEA